MNRINDYFIVEKKHTTKTIEKNEKERKNERVQKTCLLNTRQSTYILHILFHFGWTKRLSNRNLLLKYTCHRTNIIRFHVLCNISQAINPNLFGLDYD